MDESPERSRGEMIAQLLVILVLVAILVGAILYLHQYVASHASAPAISSIAERVASHL